MEEVKIRVIAYRSGDWCSHPKVGEDDFYTVTWVGDDEKSGMAMPEVFGHLRRDEATAVAAALDRAGLRPPEGDEWDEVRFVWDAVAAEAFELCGDDS